MIKPAMSYLDMVSEVYKATNVPIAAYSVSGEYAMVKAAAHKWAGSMKIGSCARWRQVAYRAGVSIYLDLLCKRTCQIY